MKKSSIFFWLKIGLLGSIILFLHTPYGKTSTQFIDKIIKENIQSPGLQAAMSAFANFIIFIPVLVFLLYLDKQTALQKIKKQKHLQAFLTHNNLIKETMKPVGILKPHIVLGAGTKHGFECRLIAKIWKEILTYEFQITTRNTNIEFYLFPDIEKRNQTTLQINKPLKTEDRTIIKKLYETILKPKGAGNKELKLEKGKATYQIKTIGKTKKSIDTTQEIFDTILQIIQRINPE